MKIRKSNRLKYYDYSNAGWYYVTICSHNHENYFGEIVNGKMNLNQIGKIIFNCWKDIAALHKHIELDYFVIMPNHIHGIIIINYVENAKSKSINYVENAKSKSINYVEDAKFASSTYDRTKMELSKLIQQFKRAATIKIKSINPELNFNWQRSFYDRIIRNERELFNIRKYIQLNPLKWDIEKNIDNLEF